MGLNISFKHIIIMSIIFLGFMFLTIIIHEGVHLVDLCNPYSDCEIRFFVKGYAGVVYNLHPVTTEKIIISEIKAYFSSFILAIICIILELYLLKKWVKNI